MRPVMSLFGGVVLIAVGVLWTLQGLGVVGGSPMTGVTLWALVGPVVALVGIGFMLRGRRPPDRHT
ncbi:hypothetical protein [Ornithinimicrobium pekingense]|uniref:Membrane protein n=1 Tax=Ornithinimicrobium pekingense TaxID=384677 RepID=A0ABQ2F9U1_9MICO|nr:hypothetical protein [Ornithinimicrobium pekingense]GGK67868.1 membrane protein [Ornithinimicrobium pekingense]